MVFLWRLMFLASMFFPLYIFVAASTRSRTYTNDGVVLGILGCIASIAPTGVILDMLYPRAFPEKHKR